MSSIKRSDVEREVLWVWQCPSCKGYNGIKETEELSGESLSVVRCEYCPSAFDVED